MDLCYARGYMRCLPYGSLEFKPQSNTGSHRHFFFRCFLPAVGFGHAQVLDVTADAIIHSPEGIEITDLFVVVRPGVHLLVIAPTVVIKRKQQVGRPNLQYQPPRYLGVFFVLQQISRRIFST